MARNYRSISASRSKWLLSKLVIHLNVILKLTDVLVISCKVWGYFSVRFLQNLSIQVRFVVSFLFFICIFRIRFVVSSKSMPFCILLFLSTINYCLTRFLEQQYSVVRRVAETLAVSVLQEVA